MLSRNILAFFILPIVNCWMNAMDKQLNYRCPDGSIIYEINSKHDNFYEDRVFEILCRRPVGGTRNCQWTNGKTLTKTKIRSFIFKLLGFTMRATFFSGNISSWWYSKTSSIQLTWHLRLLLQRTNNLSRNEVYQFRIWRKKKRIKCKGFLHELFFEKSIGWRSVIWPSLTNFLPLLMWLAFVILKYTNLENKRTLSSVSYLVTVRFG